MKVLCLTNLYPSSREPTRGPFNFNIITALARHCEVRVVAPEPWWSRVRQPRALLRTPCEKQTGIETTLPTYWSIPRMTALHASGMYASLRGHIQSIRKDFPFDAIFAAWAYPDAVAAARIAKDYSCPYLVNILGSDINVLGQVPRLQPQIRTALQGAYRVVTVSGALRERVVELGVPEERVVVQHNGVNGVKFQLRDRKAVREQLGLDPGRTMIGYVGRLGQEKGVDVLVEALHQLHHEGRPDVDLLLVGGGQTEATLRGRVDALGMAERVRFCGMRPHDEVPLWMSASDVLCLPSRREGCPNVVLESLACGVPVVASDVGGLPEILNRQNGFLVPAEDRSALASRLKAALERRWDPQALRASVEFLSWQGVADNYFRLLHEAVESRKIEAQSQEFHGITTPAPIL